MHAKWETYEKCFCFIFNLKEIDFQWIVVGGFSDGGR